MTRNSSVLFSLRLSNLRPINYFTAQKSSHKMKVVFYFISLGGCIQMIKFMNRKFMLWV